MVNLGKIRQDCLKTVLGLHKRANSGHIGSSLSCLDILVLLAFETMGPADRLIFIQGAWCVGVVHRPCEVGPTSGAGTGDLL